MKIKAKKQGLQLLLVTLTLALVATYRFFLEDNFETFLLKYVLIFVLGTGFMVALLRLVRVLARKYHIATEFSMWPLGIVLSWYVALISYGQFYVFLPGTLLFLAKREQSLGSGKQTAQFRHYALLSFFFLLVTLFAAILVFMFANTVGGDWQILLQSLVLTLLSMAIGLALPLPRIEELLTKRDADGKPLPGFFVLWHFRPLWFALLTFLIIATIGIVSVSIVLALLLALVIAIIVFILMLWHKEL